MKVSVALAAYNGQKYIKQQVQSILPQLSADDELVISLDPSQDETLSIINEIDDSRIHIISGPGRGIVHNFENALRHCSGDYIFLADQDDIWNKDKIKIVSRYLESGALLVVHDCSICDQNGNIIHPSYMEYHHSHPGFLPSIVRNSFIGCCMAFRRELLETVLPIPSYIPMHDQWLGLVAYRKGKVEFIHDNLLRYRRHDKNNSSLKSTSFGQMVMWRLGILKGLITRRLL